MDRFWEGRCIKDFEIDQTDLMTERPTERSMDLWVNVFVGPRAYSPSELLVEKNPHANEQGKIWSGKIKIMERKKEPFFPS